MVNPENESTSAETISGTASTSTGSSEIRRVAARIPPFWKDDLEIWFAQVESQFLSAGITTDETKFSAVVGALDGTVLRQVKQAVVNPPDADKYNNLKQQLLRRFDCTEQVKLRKLCSQMELGDKKPSQLLNEMRDLGGASAAEQLLYTLWIDLLPSTVVAVLEGSKENLEEKSALADRIVAALGENSISQTSRTPSNSESDQISALRLQIQALTQQVKQLSYGKNRSRSASLRRQYHRSGSSSARESSQSTKCYYHHKFGVKARKCREPCSFNKEEHNSKN